MHGDTTYSLPENGDFLSLINSGKSNKAYEVVPVSEPVLTEKIPSVDDYYGKINRLLEQGIDAGIEFKRSGLRGRGGAGFPFHIKWDTVRRQNEELKYIVCNADEGDPGAFSDMYLLEEQPHKVLAGMYIAGITAGAHEAYIYIRGEYPQSIETFQRAIDEAKDYLKDFRIRIIRGQGSYVCGEETALLNSIEGLRPEVRVRPPYPAEEGLYGKPTLLSNVETFANLPWILMNGGERFAALGTGKSTGTKLISLDNHFVRPGIYEVEMGMSAGKLIYDIAGGFRHTVKAVQIGGPLGGVVPVNKLESLNLDFESMDKAGFLLGHAGIVGIPEYIPMIEYIEHLLKFTADESCGKCYPCRIGSRRGQEMISKAIVDNIPVDRKLFDDLMETLELGSLCALGGGVPLPVRNIMEYFAGELKEYFS
jgi:NADH-quinone oxidoreductase subunit F